MPGIRRLPRSVPSVAVSVIVVVVLLWAISLGWIEPAAAASPALSADWDLFVRKGCAGCHRIRGLGNGVGGPDLAHISGGIGFFEIAAAMWNHVPQMRASMREKRVEWPRLSPQELSDVIEFLFSMQGIDPPRDAAAGQRLFVSKGCERCHAENRDERRPGPPLRELAPSTFSWASVAAVMWNHASRMGQTMEDAGTSHPAFVGREFEDVFAYIAVAGAPRSEATPVVVGVPDRGKRLFTSKGCATCHVVAGKASAGRTALVPRPSRQRVPALPGVLWNHGDAIRARHLTLPRVTGQEMADINAYLHTSYYFDPPHGDRRHGQRLIEDRGCLRCHSIYKKGAGTAPNFATSNVVGSQLGQLSAMWNHGRQMENEASRYAVVLPVLTAQELGDITSYLAGLGSGAPKTP